MVSYLNKLLWQSKRRRSVDISSRRIPLKAKNINNKDAIIDDDLINSNNNNNQDKKSPSNNNNGEQNIATNRDLEVSIKSIKSTEPIAMPATATTEDNNGHDMNNNNNKENPTQTTSKLNANMDKNKLRPMDLNLSSPLVLYAVAISVLMAVQLINCDNNLDIRRLDNNNPPSSSSSSSLLSPPANQRASPFVSTIDWHRIGSRLAQQLAYPGSSNWMNIINNNRWSYRPNDHNTRDSYRYPAGRENYLMRTFNRIRNRIGARNTIRVHNAFRDFAWQVLSRLSMPTPVIYELRRQHFYSPDEDLMNDSFYNKNTTRTIRTKRLLDNLLDWQQHNKNTNQPNQKKLISRASDDDDDEPEGFVERLRMRLDDLVSLSRRSLFGRVIRVPAIFPFKRQEEDTSQGNKSKDGGSTKQVSNGSRSTPRRRNQRFSVRRRKKESDRQMIQINGKQYYVDDDGELKEMNKDPSAV